MGGRDEKMVIFLGTFFGNCDSTKNTTECPGFLETLLSRKQKSIPVFPGQKSLAQARTHARTHRHSLSHTHTHSSRCIWNTYTLIFHSTLQCDHQRKLRERYNVLSDTTRWCAALYKQWHRMWGRIFSSTTRCSQKLPQSIKRPEIGFFPFLWGRGRRGAERLIVYWYITRFSENRSWSADHGHSNSDATYKKKKKKHRKDSKATGISRFLQNTGFTSHWENKIDDGCQTG